jgi:Predicted transcriptional regulators
VKTKVNKRIRKLRRELDLTQQKFGEQIGVKGNTITNYETGLRNPTDAVINNICKTFNVNEEWLRTGEGDMFVQQTMDDKILNNDNLINILTSLSADDWKLLIHTAARLADKNIKGGENKSE